MALMKMKLILSCVAWAAVSMPTNDTSYDTLSVPLVTFDGNASTHFDFTEEGASHSWPSPGPDSKGTWGVSGGHGVLNGEIVVEWNDKSDEVTGGWPGFVRATANGDFPDASSVSSGALILMARSSTPEYRGFHVSFGTTEKWDIKKACSNDLGPYKNRGCYKAAFNVPAGDDFSPVRIPFSSFSGAWLFGNGNIYKTCAEDKEFCMTSESLARIKTIELWAEGVNGKAHLEVKSFTASP